MKSITLLDSEFSKELELQIAPELRAGFPSPAEEYLQDSLDFNRDLIKHPESTFWILPSSIRPERPTTVR